MADETKVREFLDMSGLESYDEAMKGYVDKENKTLTQAVNVLEASKVDIQVEQNLTDEAKSIGRANIGAASEAVVESLSTDLTGRISDIESIVPTPEETDALLFLRGDNTWALPPNVSAETNGLMTIELYDKLTQIQEASSAEIEALFNTMGL